MRAFALGDPPAAASIAPGPHPQPGAAGWPEPVVFTARRPVEGGHAPGRSAVSAGAPASGGAAGRGHGQSGVAPAPGQAPAAVKRVAVRSLGAPEWRLRAADPWEAYRDSTCCTGTHAGLQQGREQSDGDPVGNPVAADQFERAGVEVLRAAFRIKGALRASRCAGMLSFPAGETPLGIGYDSRDRV